MTDYPFVKIYWCSACGDIVKEEMVQWSKAMTMTQSRGGVEAQRKPKVVFETQLADGPLRLMYYYSEKDAQGIWVLQHPVGGVISMYGDGTHKHSLDYVSWVYIHGLDEGEFNKELDQMLRAEVAKIKT